MGALAVERRSPAPPDPSFLRVTEGDSTPRFARQYNAASRFRHREIDMRENALKRLWAQDKPALGGWLTNPRSASAETFAHAGFDWVCVDTQHGLIDYQVSVEMLRAISTTDAVPIVRVPWNEPGIIMKSLDAGAYGVIVPMVNTRAEAEAAVFCCRYAPERRPQLRPCSGESLRRPRLLPACQRDGALHRHDRDRAGDREPR